MAHHSDFVFLWNVLSWEMAGDQGGWFQFLWVPLTAVVIIMVIRVWDGVLISAAWSQCTSSPIFVSNNRPSESITVSYLEMVRSLLHPHHVEPGITNAVGKNEPSRSIDIINDHEIKAL